MAPRTVKILCFIRAADKAVSSVLAIMMAFKFRWSRMFPKTAKYSLAHPC
jgi:hypothetical protein